VEQIQHTTKAVQMALGPLSGVAARLTAFNSLVRSNTVGVAAFTASIVGLVVATRNIIDTGMEYERQLLSLESSIMATGRSAQVTAGELDNMARSIANATLTSAHEARKALNILLTFHNISVDIFEEIVTAAQGISSAFGSDLTANTRLLARAIEQPSNSLDSLRRVGIQFTDQQKELIRLFEKTGQVAKAQEIVFERIEVFIERAKNEAEGLAGQLDAVSDNMALLVETISTQINTNERLSEVYEKINAGLEAIIQNTDGIAAVIEGFSKTLSVFSKILSFVGKNIEFVGALLTAVFVGGLTKVILLIGRWMAAQLKVIPAIVATTAALFKKQTAANAAAASTTRLATSLRLLNLSFGAVSLIAGVVSFAIMKVVSANYQAERSTQAVSRAQKALTASSEEALEAMQKLQETTGAVKEDCSICQDYPR